MVRCFHGDDGRYLPPRASYLVPRERSSSLLRCPEKELRARRPSTTSGDILTVNYLILTGVSATQQEKLPVGPTTLQVTEIMTK